VSGPVVVVFEMGDRSHFNPLRPLIGGMVARGARVVVFTTAAFAEDVRANGAEFVDVFEGRPLAAIDNRSIPPSSRFISFAARCAPEIIEQVRGLGAELVVHDTFAVIATVVANALGLRRVNCGNAHVSHPDGTQATIDSYPRVVTDPACLEACAILERDHGLAGMTPMSFFSNISPDLNLHREPARWVSAAERTHNEPMAAFGSLPDGVVADPGADCYPPGAGLRVHVSFGSVIWRFFTVAAVAALEAIVGAFTALDPPARMLVSLGGADIGDAALARLRRPGVDVRPYFDTLHVLAQTDILVTHNGLGSTHEAILHEVPMIGYPFNCDQPILARAVRELDLGVTLGAAPRAPITQDDVLAALAELQRRRPEIEAGLRRARGWELETIAQRPQVVDRVLALARPAQPAA
jgi:UDP:flavonoid glycosyltransferase YjiC (YdhE family)